MPSVGLPAFSSSRSLFGLTLISLLLYCTDDLSNINIMLSVVQILQVLPIGVKFFFTI
jgi:hypothetical protein